MVDELDRRTPTLAGKHGPVGGCLIHREGVVVVGGGDDARQQKPGPGRVDVFARTHSRARRSLGNPKRKFLMSSHPTSSTPAARTVSYLLSYPSLPLSFSIFTASTFTQLQLSRMR